MILIVDDNIDIRNVLRAHCRKRALESVEAGDGLEALQVLSQRPPDVVILDLKMPRLDGFGFLERLHGLPGPHPPVVVYAACDDEPNRARARQLGAMSFVSKGDKITDLFAEVQRAMQDATPA